MAIQVYGGEIVRILTSGGEVDPNIYTVDFVRRSVVGLTNQKTSIEVKVHRSRIHEIVEDNNMNSSDSLKSDSVSEATATEQTAQAAKPKKVRKPKAKPEPINFATLAQEGFRIWAKDVDGGLGTDPKVKGIKVNAICMIAPDKSGYEIFNTYNGTRGKKGKIGKVFDFSEKMTLEKKQRQLTNKGYTQIFAQIQAAAEEEAKLEETKTLDETETVTSERKAADDAIRRDVEAHGTTLSRMDSAQRVKVIADAQQKKQDEVGTVTEAAVETEAEIDSETETQILESQVEDSELAATTNDW